MNKFKRRKHVWKLKIEELQKEGCGVGTFIVKGDPLKIGFIVSEDEVEIEERKVFGDLGWGLSGVRLSISVLPRKFEGRTIFGVMEFELVDSWIDENK